MGVLAELERSTIRRCGVVEVEEDGPCRYSENCMALIAVFSEKLLGGNPNRMLEEGGFRPDRQ
jgi:hypothetical protein